MNNQKANRNLFTFGAFSKRLRLALTLGILLAVAFGLVMFRAQAARTATPPANAPANEAAQFFMAQNSDKPSAPLATLTCDTGMNVDVEATGGTLQTGYATLSAAIAAINAGTHTGTINVEICANVTETAAMFLNSNAATPANYTAVNIYPLADGLTISGPTVLGRGLIELNGADDVTIDGDNPLTAGTNRNLTITNTAATTVNLTSVIRVAVIAAVPNANNITIRNLNINGNGVGRNVSTFTSTTNVENSSFAIYAGGLATGATTAPGPLTSVSTNTAAATTTINNFNVTNNAVNTCARGIFFNGAAAAVSTGVTISNNQVGDHVVNNVGTPPYTTPTTTVYTKPIFVAGTTALTITNNSIKNIISYVSTATNGIELNSAIGAGGVTITGNTIDTVVTNTGSATQGIIHTQALGTYNISSNIISNISSATAASSGILVAGTATSGTVAKNKITNIKQRSGGFRANGITVSSGNAVTVQNNFISDVLNTGSASFGTGFNSNGILLLGGLNHRVYHNSVNLFGVSASVGSNSVNCLAISAITQTGIDVRNNVFANQVTGGAATDAHVAVFLPFTAAATMNLTLNNNDYFVGSIAGKSGVAFAGATSYAAANVFDAANFDPTMITPATNFRSFSTLLGVATNDDASKKVDPIFVSATDLHIQSASPMESMGANVSVADDIDGDARGGSPDIGADEITLAGAGTVQFSAASYTNAEGATATITVNRTGGVTGALSVDYATSDGTATAGVCGSGGDYVATSGTLNWANGDSAAKTFTVMLCADLLRPDTQAPTEATETVNLTLSNPMGTSITGTNPATLNITDVPPMVYVSSTATQVAGNIPLGGMNQNIIGIEVVTSGSAFPLSVTDFALNTNGTTSTSDITNAKLWYTGTSPTFATGTQFGATVPAPSGPYNITGSQTLASGTNYFWLTYDIPVTATVNNLVDAEVTSITVGSAQTPTVTAPAGSKTIVAQVTIPGANTNTLSDRKPLGSFFGFERSAAIYTAAELGLVSGSTIQNMCWFLNSSASPVTPPVRILMKTTTSSTFAAATTVAAEETGATLVYDATPTLVYTAGAFQCIPLTSPFAYTGDNLEIIVEANAGGAGNEGSTSKQYRHSTATSAHQTWQADNTAPAFTGTVLSTRPNIQFNYIPPVAAPGVVEFSATTYAGAEGAMATITATRTNGNVGAVSAMYATSNGTATAGTCGSGGDYVSTSGTLSWANMDTADKTFTVTLCSDAVSDPAETVNLMLSNPTGGATIGANNPAVLTITDVPPPLSGSYNVPGDFASLTNAGGIFDALNTSGASGNININIADNLTGENGGVALNELAGGFTVTIRPGTAPPPMTTVPSGVARSITGASGTSLIKLSGADGVTIDGSLSGGTDRSLTISNTGAGAIIWIATNATSGANSNTLKNCILSGGGGIAVGTQGIIAGSGTTFGNPAEFSQSNNTIQNNAISGVQNAAFISGNATTLDQNWMVTGNTFGSSVTANKLSFRGMFIGNAQNFTVSDNAISGISSSTGTSSTMSGIQVASNINGGTITRNQIKDIRQNNTVGWGSNGIYLNATTTASNVTVSNNFIFDVASVGFAGVTSQDNGYGIMIDTGGGYNIYHNTVSMNTSQTAAGSITAALNIASAVTTAGGLDVRNNIFSNSETVGTRYAVYDDSTAAIFSSINYNDYFAQNVGFLTSARVTLTDWQTATTQDANSQDVDPVYVDPASDLHLQAATSPLLGDGTPIVSVTTDFDADPRPASAPDIGADEVVQASGGTIAGGTYYNAATADGNMLGGNVIVTNNLTLSGIVNTGSNTLTVNCNATITGATANNYVNGNLQLEYCATGSKTFPVGELGSTPFNSPSGTVDTGYSPVTINFTTLSNPPALVTANANVGRIAGTDATNAINRNWELTNSETQGTYNANIDFTYGNDDLIGYTGGTPINRVFRLEAGELDVINPLDVTFSGNTVSAANINQFSQWGLGGNPNAPTLAVVKNHEGYRFNDGNLIRWQSSFEQDNLGFRVYRQGSGISNLQFEIPNSRAQIGTLITPNLIAGSALMTGKTPLASGKSYSWFDANGTPGSIYYVEDVDLNGKTTLHGPITLKAEGNRADIGSSPLLNELRPAGNGTGAIERQVAPRELRSPNQPEAGSDAFATQLALAGRNAVKLGVRQSGWYRVNGGQLQAAGLPANADARFLQLYVNGEQVPIALRTSTGGDAGAIGADGVIEFYGVGNDTRESDTATYWLIVGDTPGLRIGQPVRSSSGGGDVEGGSSSQQSAGAVGSSGISNPESGIPVQEIPNAKSNSSNSFAYTVERKDRTVYAAAIQNGDAENFFGAIINDVASNQTLRVSKPAANIPTTATLSVALQGATEGAHQVAVSFNGAQVGVMSFDGQQRKVSRFNVPHAALAEGDNTVTLRSLNGSADVSVTDYLRLTYQHRYEADDNRLLFSTGQRNGLRVNGFTANNVRVFDLTEPGRYFQVSARAVSDGDGYAVTVNGQLNNRQLLAIADSQALSPVSVEANEPSSWTRPENQADFIIVAPRVFSPATNSLAAWRRQQQGLRVSVVHLEDIFDEWSGGLKDVHALRGFLRYAQEKWNIGPQYVLFVGDASIDPRNYLGYGDTDLVPTAYVNAPGLETSSDETLVDFNDDGIGEMSVGRWPVRTSAQAHTLVYRALLAQPDASRRAVFVADQPQGYNFEQMNQDARALLPSDMPVSFINRNGQSDATVRGQIVAAVNEGPALVQYAGHGSTEVWTGSPIFSGGDASALTNGANRLPLFVTMTCLNGYFQDVSADSLAEALMKAPNGGALAVWASSSLTMPQDQAPMNRAFIQAIYGGSGMRLGDAARQAKAATGDQTVRRTWILFGDPTARLR